MQLTLVQNFSDEWNIAYGNAFIDWDEEKSIVLALVDGGTSPGACDPTNGTIEVCADEYGINGWLGLAQIWTRGPLAPMALVSLACPAGPVESQVTREQAIETARQEVSFQPDSVDAVLSTSEEQPVWRVTFRGRLPGQPEGWFETIIVEIERRQR